MTGCLEVSRGMEAGGYQRDRPTQGATALSQVEPGLLPLLNMQCNATQPRAVFLELQLFCTRLAKHYVVDVTRLLANQERCLFLLLTLGHRRSRLRLRKTFSNQQKRTIMQIEVESG